MVSYRGLQRRRKVRRRSAEDEPTQARPARVQGDKFGLTTLQQQVGNQAIQRVMAQRQAAQEKDQTQKDKEPVEIGQVKVEKPEIKPYEVTGESLHQAADQILSPEQWYEYEYQYSPKIENEVITQVEITVMITIHVPRWVGSGWDRASDVDKLAWLQMLQRLGASEDSHEEMGMLPRRWIGIDFSLAPDDLKGEWQKMLVEWQANEKGPVDIVRRRVMVLQQRLLKRPEAQIAEIFDKFLQDIEVEETIYKEEREPGQENKVILEPDALVQ